MKKERILTLVLCFLAIVVFYIYSKPTYNLIKNYSLDYTKEVYLGGDNIVLDYLIPNNENAVAAVSQYATIGTITYIEEDGKYGAVGHNLGNNDLKSGNIYIVPVYSVIKSNKTNIGEKTVNMSYWKSSGTIESVNETGVYGNFEGDLFNKTKLLFGMPKEIKRGEALLYTNVSGNEVKAYKIEIERVLYIKNTHNIYLKVVDDELLEITGGIIQGMSGSPIVQNGKIIGVLSHVDTSNPIYGYGSFITNME